MPDQEQFDHSQHTEEFESTSATHWQQLTGDDLEEYQSLNLPNTHPQLLARALMAQLERMPLLEQQAQDQSLPTGTESMALLA